MENPSFYLEGVIRDRSQMQDFEGPLSLILMLLQKNKIEIRDIKIADILDQYLEYLDNMQRMDLEIASEFVQMAAHLLYIKTRTLLTGDEEVSELEVLMASLEQLKCKDAYSAVQTVLPRLKDAAAYGMLFFAKLPEPEPRDAREYNYSHEPVDLLKAMYSVYSRGGRTPNTEELISAVPKPVQYSIVDKTRELIARLKKGKTSLNNLYAACATRTEIVATFISVLELCSMGSIHLERTEEGYQVSFVGGDEDEILNKISE